MNIKERERGIAETWGVFEIYIYNTRLAKLSGRGH